MDFLKNLSISKKLYLSFFSIGVASVLGYGIVSYKNLANQRQRDLLESFRSNTQALSQQLANDQSNLDEKIKNILYALNDQKQLNQLLYQSNGIEAVLVQFVDQNNSIQNYTWKKNNQEINQNILDYFKKNQSPTETQTTKFDNKAQFWLITKTIVKGSQSFHINLILQRSYFLRDFWAGGFGDNYLLLGNKESHQIIQNNHSSNLSGQSIEYIFSDRNSGVYRLKNKSFVAFFNIADKIWLISELPKSQIQSALKSFFVRSFLFLLFLLSTIPIVSILVSHYLTSRLKHLANLTKETAKGNFKARIIDSSKDEIGKLGRNFNFMNEKIEELIEETREKVRMEGELKVAKTVQEAIIPEADFNNGNIEISGFYQPASECGGDIWSYKETANFIYFCIGDATGHGVAPALVTTAANSVFSMIDHLNEPDINELCTLLNRVVRKTAKGKINMTFFTGIIDKKTLEFTYSCASHDPPTWVDEDSGESNILNETICRRLGELDDYKVESSVFQLKKNHRILFYTDGITETKNPKGRDYGFRKLSKLFEKLVKDEHLENAEIIKIIKTEIEEYSGGAPQDDDITYCLIRVS